MQRRVLALVVMCLALLGAVGISQGAAHDATPSATPEATQPPVVREVLNEGYPEAAPGQVLQLVRYTIAPGEVLPVHIHPGMQVALIEAGTLHYTVLEGSVDVTRADGMVETIQAGQETEFEVGDRFVEAQGMVHFGENRGDTPIVILVASLFAADQPPSTVVEVATPAA